MREVPRAPKAEDVPDALRRMDLLRRKACGDTEGHAGRREFPFAPVSCVLAGSGMLLLAVSLAVELAPRSLFSRLLVLLCGALPFGG